ncbi:AbrB/MazE/SpoVT family DNA-binding domain-containing protein [Carboxylicivirga caseinilyticus]|uniref:AbrB/MazE/SpoVT family DNA-binding domain-containing protein n=1 Tax=Carboxylicivirga caseinilyticus TaxID=3417572 RepID=UPI003D33777C|nr:hypothetical protein [Marinilabiliaceae bacterium A049]
MIITIEKNDNANNYLPLPDEIIKRYDLKVGDKLAMLQRKRGVLVVPLPHKMVKNRNGEDVNQIYEVVQRNFRSVEVEYVSCYYFDYYVDENTGVIDYTRFDKFYTSEQSDYDTKSFKEAYLDALDGETPQEKMIDNIDPTTLHDEIDFGGPVGNEEW